MDSYYAIEVIVKSKSEKFPLKFATDAASILEKEERISCEIIDEGLLIQGV